MNASQMAIRAVPFERVTAAGVATQLLTERHRQNLVGLATSLNVPRRTIFYREETPAEWVFMISSGVVKWYRDLPNGKRHITAFLFRETCSVSQRTAASSTRPRRSRV